MTRNPAFLAAIILMMGSAQALGWDQWRAPKEDLSMKDLLEKGYEVKGVYLINYGRSTDPFAILQKGSEAFMCRVDTADKVLKYSNVFSCAELTRPAP